MRLFLLSIYPAIRRLFTRKDVLFAPPSRLRVGIVAALVGADASHVVFTSGATEAANLVLCPHFKWAVHP